MEAEDIVVVPFSSLLMEIVDNRGKSCPFTTAGTPLIATNCIKNDNLFPTYETTKFVDTETYAQWFRGHPIPGDLIFVTKGSPGRVCIAPDPVDFCIAQDMVALRVNETKVYPRFLFALLRTRSVQEQIEQLHVGTMIPHFKKGDFDKLLLRLPSRKSQEFIGDLYFDLSFKIELNRQRNRTLEAMARALFQSWFVDFDPVKAKAAGKQHPGLKPEIAALFPNRFEESALGIIPKGWVVTTMGDEVNASKGLSYKGSCLALPGEGVPMHNLNSVYEGGGYKHEGLKWYSGEYRESHTLQPGDVIVTNTEQGFEHRLIGYAAIVPKRYGAMGIFSHHVFRLQSKPNSYLPSWYFYLLLRTPVFHDIVAGHSNGTTVNMLPADGLQKPKIVRPPRGLIEIFTKLFDPISVRLELLIEENECLTALRDMLLPKLVSGELRIPDAERIVARSI
jgi:type I restriction enzyme S subunit